MPCFSSSAGRTIVTKNTKRSKWGGFPEPYRTGWHLQCGRAQPGGPVHTSFTHHTEEVTLKFGMGVGEAGERMSIGRLKEQSNERKKAALSKTDALEEFRTH